MQLNGYFHFFHCFLVISEKTKKSFEDKNHGKRSKKKMFDNQSFLDSMDENSKKNLESKITKKDFSKNKNEEIETISGLALLDIPPNMTRSNSAPDVAGSLAKRFV